MTPDRKPHAMAVTWTYAFAAAKPAGDLKALLGGKGASLAEMTAAGLRVPPGFTIVTRACAEVLAAGGAWPEGLELHVAAELAALESATGRRFGAGARPLLVSVRSGAAASMPGMMDTVLNCGLTIGLAEEVDANSAFWTVLLQHIAGFARIVAGIPEAQLEAAAPGYAPSRELAMARIEAYARLAGRPFPATPAASLRQCIDAVFRSWNNPRAVAYRDRHGIRGLDGTAVTVQAMWPSQISGVLFTQDPNAVTAGRMIIESAYGLGEAVVSGDVTPDRYVVARDGLAIAARVPGTKAARVVALGEERAVDPTALSLDDARVRELAELGLRVEAHYGVPVDIEWGIVDGVVALLQARPIRGIEVAQAVEPARQAAIAQLTAAAGGRRKVWVAHNLGETLPRPTPLTWDLVRRFMAGDGGFGRMYRDFGYDPSPAVRRDGFLDLILGRIYADPERLAGLFWSTMPLGYDLALVARDAKALDRPPTRFVPERADPLFLLRAPGTLWRMRRCARTMARARRTAKVRFEDEILPTWRTWCDGEERRDLAAASHDELLGVLAAREARVLDQFAGESLKPGFFGAVALARVVEELGALLGPAEGQALAATLTLALDGDTTVEQNLLLWDVAQGRSSLDPFLARFGHRCSGEMELMTPRWREDATPLTTLLASLRAPGARDPHALHHANRQRRDQAEAALPERLRLAGGSSLRESILADLADARALLPYREAGKHWLMRGYALLRDAIEALARRHDLGRMIWFLRREELARLPAERDRLLAEAGRRHLEWQAQQRLDPATIIDSADLTRLGLAAERAAGDAWQGDPISPGTATGPARIVIDPAEAGDLGTGYILVCPSTDPGWTPLFLNAKGLVVERGGVLSHGAIVARDFGIPAICLPGATVLIAAGATIQIDGSAGRVALAGART